MNRFGIVLFLAFLGIALVWGGFLVGRTHRTRSISKCIKGFDECLFLLDQTDQRLNECRLRLPRRSK